MSETPVGFKNGTIVLDERRGVFYPGQIISGKVHFRLMSTLTFGVIKIKYLGEAIVKWTENQTMKYSGESRVIEELFQGREEYFNHTQILSGGQGMCQLPAGGHSLPFSYQLPFNIPSSFSGDKGRIEYFISVYIDFLNNSMQMETISRPFEIVGALDLNINPIIKKPLVIELEEMYSNCCLLDCGSVPVTVTAHLPVSGYCPGQIIEAAVDVNNKSSYELWIVFQLISKVKYHSNQPVSDYVPPEQVLAKVKKGPIMSGVQRHFSCDLVVPDMIAPNLEFCSIIDIGYFVKVTVAMTGCNDDMWDEVEICLGLVPLERDKESYRHPMQHSLPAGPVPDPRTAIPASNQSTNSSVGFKALSNLESHLPYPANDSYPMNIPTNTPYTESAQINLPYPSASVTNPPYPTDLNINHPMPNVNSPHPYPTQNPNDEPPPYSSVSQNRPSSPYTVTPSAPPAN